MCQWKTNFSPANLIDRSKRIVSTVLIVFFSFSSSSSPSLSDCVKNRSYQQETKRDTMKMIKNWRKAWHQHAWVFCFRSMGSLRNKAMSTSSRINVIGLSASPEYEQYESVKHRFHRHYHYASCLCGQVRLAPENNCWPSHAEYLDDRLFRWRRMLESALVGKDTHVRDTWNSEES